MLIVLRSALVVVMVWARSDPLPFRSENELTRLPSAFTTVTLLVVRSVLPLPSRSRADHPSEERREEPYDCADELQRKAPLLHTFWSGLAKTALKGHTLVRCYANGHTFGSDGSLHTDSVSPRSFTSIYYPHDRWSPNWGGETVFFNREETDIVASIYPKPNRLLIFQGAIPHVARGVSRICPVLRVTLMFKTEAKDG